jgi:uncharacterized membrane protein
MRIVLFVTILIALLVLDAVWLTMRKSYHLALFENIQKSPLTLRWLPAAFVYILLAGAITWSLQSVKSVPDAIQRGAVVGGVMYGFYDATNMATLRGWTWEMVLTDTVWGAFASACAAGIGYGLTSK